MGDPTVLAGCLFGSASRRPLVLASRLRFCYTLSVLNFIFSRPFPCLHTQKKKKKKKKTIINGSEEGGDEEPTGMGGQPQQHTCTGPGDPDAEYTPVEDSDDDNDNDDDDEAGNYAESIVTVVASTLLATLQRNVGVEEKQVTNIAAGQRCFKHAKWHEWVTEILKDNCRQLWFVKLLLFFFEFSPSSFFFFFFFGFQGI